MAGLLDFFMGSGDYADPTKVDERYGVPMSDVRQAALNSIGNMGAILMAAGQRMEPAQRAAYLAQLGQAGGNFNTDIYNASQRRLMAARTEEQRREMEENKRIAEEMKDTAGFKAKYGFDPTGFGAGDVRAAVKQINVNRLSRDPETVRRARLENEALERDAEAQRRAAEYLAQRAGGQAPAGAAPAGVAAPPVAGAPAAAPAMPGMPGMPRSAATYQIPNNIVQSLLAGGVKPREIIKMEAEGALKQDTWIPIPPGDNEMRKGIGLSPTQPAKIKLDAQGNVVDWQIQGEDPGKAPAGFENDPSAPQGQRRLRPIAGGPQEQIAAEVGARVGLAESFKPYAKSIREALDAGKFDLSNVPNRASLVLGVGEMGALSRRMNVGKEALVRGLTGAGMNVSEAETYANQYGIGPTDSPETIRDKLNMMEWSLDNVKAIVTRGRGELSPIGSGPAPFGSKATGNNASAAPKVRGLIDAEDH
jgi:hypothetical protein